MNNMYIKANLIGADLRRADFINANLTEANLTGANLRGANLRKANLRGANLTGANLTDADLIGANLADADLTGADLTGADLTYATLTEADLIKAILPSGETWEQYIQSIPNLLTAGGRTLSDVTEHWDCHHWTNCPLAAAFGVHTLEDIPVEWQSAANQFLQFFDAGLIPRPTI
jgi:hypothetical protein